jgi:hypothetical protein
MALKQGGGTVHSFTVSDSSGPPVVRQASLPEVLEPETVNALLATSSEATTGYDPTLLIAALEEVQARQAAIEWLLDANLLCLCFDR